MTYTMPDEFTTRPTLKGSFGMSASTHWLATASSQAVLERGGNAFDAAVAAAFVLHVVEPHLNGPGGDMTGVFVTAEAPSEPVVMNGQGPAPAAASIESYTAMGVTLVPGAGALAAAVPAAVDAWLKLLEEHGTWELSDVLSYAIHYAEAGHPIVSRVSSTIASVKELFAEHWPSSAAHWLPAGEVPEPGTVMRNQEYADVLRGLVGAGSAAATREERIAAARAEWRSGRVAHAIAEFVTVPHRHADGKDHPGVITYQDLVDGHAEFEPAATATFRGYTIAKTGPWGQGPMLLQALKILEGFDDERLDPSTELGAHTILEALKLALADRDVYYGEAAARDPQLLADLLSDEYAAERRNLITDTASAEFRPGNPGGRTPVFMPPLVTAEEWAASDAGRAATAGVGEPTVERATTSAGGAAEGVTDPNGEHRGDTCHLDVVDRWGNMISATPSGGWLQSSPEIPGLGFCLGTRLQMTWLDPESPSALVPGDRPRTTLTPTLILKDGVPVYALGSPGGDQQDQWQLSLILRLLVGGYEPQQAIDAPMINTSAMPGSFYPRIWTPAGAEVEDRLGEDVIAGLAARGHAVHRAGDWALGRLSCVGIDPATGVYLAGANPRGAQGYAAGR
ncbi:gamma-glutamyltransferase family protein [Brevibacterium sp. 91QC2O2]|uniref:gamma-glutamyltransferase family protein n=1 Tax=Brevibacterium TaxID=1696 RepID=UPI00211B7F10|nr:MULTISPECIES: gamma-glutamyltransferase family protein [unclassified Brevibacterium]MCQ9368875.1 gamma-glutamyltransferase family protein [Brevibacterium sp. 91QC2O2]MCQ9386626.1 gamma-glutamyltransferase family protein [Brevibacterium sp. 68QC2CO]